MARSKNAPDRVRAAQKKVTALALRAEGLTYEAIGTKIGLSEERARQMVREEMDKLKEQTVELAAVLRQERLSQLGELLSKYLKAALAATDVRATETVLKIMDRESKLLGLDAPTQKVLKNESQNPFEGLSLDDLRAEARRRGIPIPEQESDHVQAE